MSELYNGLRQHPEAFIAGVVGLLVGVLTVLVVGTTTVDEPLSTALVFLNFFKFGVGLYALSITFYLFYSPSLHNRGIVPRLTLAESPPVFAPLLFASLATTTILSSVAIVNPGIAQIVFWRIVGYSVLGAFLTGYFVLLVERHGSGGD